MVLLEGPGGTGAGWQGLEFRLCPFASLLPLGPFVVDLVRLFQGSGLLGYGLANTRDSTFRSEGKTTSWI